MHDAVKRHRPCRRVGGQPTTLTSPKTSDETRRDLRQFLSHAKSRRLARWMGPRAYAGGEPAATGSRLLFTRGYSVFNAGQVDGYAPIPDAEIPMPVRISHAETFFASIAADVRHGGNQAFYSPATDHIQMPPFPAFAENVSYYSVLAHEHTHWTASAGRCNRELGKRFGDSAYAAEELVAELGAAFTNAPLGLSTEPRADHARYLASWLKVLKADKGAIFTAASKAQQATDWLIQRAGESAHVAGVAAWNTSLMLGTTRSWAESAPVS